MSALRAIGLARGTVLHLIDTERPEEARAETLCGRQTGVNPRHLTTTSVFTLPPESVTCTGCRPKRLRGNRTLPGDLNDGRDFPWGPIDAVHRIGRYAVVEYRIDRSNHSATQPECWVDHGETRFSAFIDGRGSSWTSRTLDSALVHAIDHARRGPNSQAARHFDLMTLGTIPEGDS